MVDPVSISLTGVGGVILGFLGKMLKDFTFNSNCRYGNQPCKQDSKKEQKEEEESKK